LGVLTKEAALEVANQAGLDLVVVSEKAKPPVAKILDFQKYKYQQAKKERAGAAKQKASDSKEVRLTPFMAANDFQHRLDQAREFLTDGYRLKIVVKFHGRQITRKEFGVQQLDKAVERLSDISKIDQPPKWQGKLYIVQLKPTGNKNDQKN
jgi:translation initiation factor IF-3